MYTCNCALQNAGAPISCLVYERTVLSAGNAPQARKSLASCKLLSAVQSSNDRNHPPSPSLSEILAVRLVSIPDRGVAADNPLAVPSMRNTSRPTPCMFNTNSLLQACHSVVTAQPGRNAALQIPAEQERNHRCDVTVNILAQPISCKACLRTFGGLLHSRFDACAVWGGRPIYHGP